jgi:glyoxylase I family protein
MTVKGLHHCSTVVTDLNRARRFYRDVLGLKEAPIPSTFDFPVAWFQFGDQQIHLLPRQHADPPSPRHFALWVDDAKAWRKRLRELGVEIQEATPIKGADRFFLHDPDGNLIELIEWRGTWPEVDPDARPLPPLD